MSSFRVRNGWVRKVVALEALLKARSRGSDRSGWKDGGGGRGVALEDVCSGRRWRDCRESGSQLLKVLGGIYIPKTNSLQPISGDLQRASQNRTRHSVDVVQLEVFPHEGGLLKKTHDRPGFRGFLTSLVYEQSSHLCLAFECTSLQCARNSRIVSNLCSTVHSWHTYRFSGKRKKLKR